MSQEEDTYEQAVYYVRSSEHAEAIVRELAREGLRRPSDILEEVKQQTGVTRSNFYDTLRRIEGVLVEKHDGPGRATLYELTETGEQVAEDFSLTTTNIKSEAESVTISVNQPLSEALREFMHLKRATPDEIRATVDQIEDEVDLSKRMTTPEHTTEEHSHTTKSETDH